MPLFDFHCPACDTTFETLVRASDEPTCPQCGSPEIDKLVANTAPPPTSGAIIQRGRALAAQAGHLSNFSRAERGKS